MLDPRLPVERLVPLPLERLVVARPLLDPRPLVERDEPERDELEREEVDRDEVEREDVERLLVEREERPAVVPFAAFASCFCACSNSRWSAFPSLLLSRRALVMNLRTSPYRSPAPLPASRVLPLLSSPSAFCAVSSEVVRRLSAAGCLNGERERVEVDRLA